MRRLDWIAVSICLALLLASRAMTPAAPETLARPVLETPPSSPFAWIREDGTEIYLPSTGPDDIATHPAPETSTTSKALYTWSSAVDSPAT
jgi:hypothetical protein